VERRKEERGVRVCKGSRGIFGEGDMGERRGDARVEGVKEKALVF